MLICANDRAELLTHKTSSRGVPDKTERVEPKSCRRKCFAETGLIEFVSGDLLGGDVRIHCGKFVKPGELCPGIACHARGGG